MGTEPDQLHLQFGADAASQVSVSWAAQEAVARPRLRFSGLGRGGGEVQATERGYTDALTGQTCYTYHARLDSLEPDTSYGYQVLHDGAPPAQGTFRTGPRGRSRPFRFTSFGDQGIPGPVGLGLGPHSANAGYVVDAVESLEPLFHLANGDLAYGNISDQPAATWDAYFRSISRSARFRPWMPALGNHENEGGNGPQGYLAYLTRFELPGNGTQAFAGNWYAFTAGSALVISLNNDDVCLQDGGFSRYRRDHVPGYDALGVDPYLTGYSGGRQRAWLERVLARARAAGDIDWIIVCMHQVAMSTAHFNGADLGSDPAEMDTRHGAVHLTIGGGGHPATEATTLKHGPGEGMVITAVEAGDPWHFRSPVLETEEAAWSAYQGEAGGFGFAACDLVPAEAGGTTSITVTYYAAAAGSPDYRPRDSFVLRKPLPSLDPCDRELTWAARRQ